MTNNTTKNETNNDEVTQTRKPRRKVYERVKETEIPRELREVFGKNNYNLRWVRWQIQGTPDYRYLNKREREGYEFVTKQELPKDFARLMRYMDTDMATGLVTNGGDLCLMKIDSDLAQSRKEYYDDVTDQEVGAVDTNVLNKKGFNTRGSRTQIMNREPSFQE